MTSRAHQPYRLPVGELAVVVPDQGRRFTNAQRVDLAAAVLLHAGSYEGPAREMISLLEQRLGVNPAHRRALDTSPADVRAEIADKRRRMLDASREAATRPAQARDPEFVEKIAQAALSAHERRSRAEELRAAGAKKHRREIKVLLNQAREFDWKAEQIRDQELEQYRLYGAARDQILLAKLRGDDIDARDVETAEIAVDEYGARIIERRGSRRGLPALVISNHTRVTKLEGIRHALAAGYLRGVKGALPELRLVQIGEAYAAAYEIIEGEATHAGEGGGGFKPKAPLPRNIEAGETLADMREALSPRQRAVLDLVCGKNWRLRPAAASLGAGFSATKTALVSGLRAAEEGRIAARKRRASGGERPISQHVAEVNAILRRVAPGF